MSARSFLDALALLRASRRVATKFAALQSQQLDIYSKTSSLARAFKNQTDREIPPAQENSENERQPENTPRPKHFLQQQNTDELKFEPPTTNDDVARGYPPKALDRKAVDQDHIYSRLKPNKTSSPLVHDGLRMKQLKADGFPLPDGSFSPSDLGNGEVKTIPTKPNGLHNIPQTSIDQLSNWRLNDGDSLLNNGRQKGSFSNPTQEAKASIREQREPPQRRVERQNPSVQLPYARSQDVQCSNSLTSELDVGQETDFSYSSRASKNPPLSFLGHGEIPRGAEADHGGDKATSVSGGNGDLVDSFKWNSSDNIDPDGFVAPNQDPAVDVAYSEPFRSRKVAGHLNRKRYPETMSKSMRMEGPNVNSLVNTKAATAHDEETFNQRTVEGGKRYNPTEASSNLVAATIAINQTQPSTKIPAIDKEENTLNGERKGVEDLEETASRTLASHRMHESRVPSSRLGRLWQYGGLASSMAFGAVGESIRRAAGSSEGNHGSIILSESNVERLVAKLSRMRGAALKLGQMVSFQDSKLLPKPIHEVLQRVQDSADYMPASQRNKVLATNLGSQWRDLFTSFEEMPMAAASIGQVHGAVLKATGQRVAVKVQYPGVADSIDSDLNNLSLLLNTSRLLPKGLYLDKTIANARTELAWECDYIREAESAKRFKGLLHSERDIFLVPSIVDEASGQHVLTMERMEGTAVTKVCNLTQIQKNWIGSQILRLCLREIIEFKYMQTDPNWTNFLFNPTTHKLELLDFGASRAYSHEFIDHYTRLLLAASEGDRKRCHDLSIQLGYLTGHESQPMLNAHISSILTLAEPFTDNGLEEYDFRNQTITDRVKQYIPLMVKERLAPPPEETYSLHRKLSGAFLLCARLGSRVRCREMFQAAMQTAGLR